MTFPRYDDYKDSGVEWLGEVPAHWDVVPLRRAIKEIESGTSVNAIDTPASDGELGVLKTSCVYRGTFDPLENKAILPEEHPRVSCPIIAGSLIVSRMNTPDLVGAAGLVAKQSEYLYLPDRLWQVRFSDADASFVHRWTQSPLYRAQVQMVCAGASSSMQNLSQDDFRSFLLPLPPLSEQTTIASFLDSETAKIDDLVAEQQNLIALLKEKRQALISHAVTKGLNPNVAMKDSGVEWLGEVPAHWDVMPLSRLTAEKCDGPFGSGIKSEHYTESGALVVRLQNIRADGFFQGEPVYLDLDYFQDELRRHAVLPGDLLLAGLGDDNNLVGRASVAPAGLGPALVKADCFRFRIDRKRVTPEFAAFQLNCSANVDAGRLATGSTRSRIPLTIMATRITAIPPLSEQNAIVAFLDGQRRTVDVLSSEAESTITLLQERRTALISAAVTGKIDVRNRVSRKEVAAA